MSAAPLIRPSQQAPQWALTGDALSSIERAMTCIVGLSEARRPSTDSRELRFPLDRAAYSVLCRIADASSIRLTELAATMGIDLSTASRQVRALEERGLIARMGDPDDQRTKWLELTDVGALTLEEAKAVRISTLRSRLASWQSDDLAELARLLERFVDSVESGRGVDRTILDDDAVEDARDADPRTAALRPQRLSAVGGTQK